MLEVESAEEENQEAAARLQEEQERWQEQKSALSEEQDQLASRLNALLATRQEQASRLDQKHLSAYESTRSKRGGIAVAVVKDGTCQVCGVRVSSSKIHAAQEGALMRCGSCDRLLVIWSG
jgi:predicted  nucleic acid-binding Zn-ribbon protein